MEKLQLGRTRTKVTVLGMGTWKYGADPAAELHALETGMAHGIRLIDTAEMYHSEALVGRFLHEKRGIFVATKVSPSHFHYDDVITACNRSLASLHTKSVDLYQLHWPNRRIPIKETMAAMEELVRTGKVRHIGVSNFSVEELKDAQSAMKETAIVSNQVEYSILVRNVEKDLLPYCKKEGITIIAYSPLARGALFSGKFAPVLRELRRVGRKHKKTAAQIALNYIISRGAIPIPKASDPKHMREIAGAAGFSLSKKELGELGHFMEDYTARALVPIDSHLLKSAVSAWSGVADLREKFRQKGKTR